MVMFFAIIESMDNEIHMPIIGGTIEDFTVIDTKGVPHYMEGSPIGDIELAPDNSRDYQARAFVAETVRRSDDSTIMVGRIATISCRGGTDKMSLACTPAYVGPPKPNMPQSRKRA